MGLTTDQWIAICVGGPAALATLFTPLVVAARWLNRRLNSIETDLGTMKSQYRNNGGSTMRDAVDRIEGKVDGFGETLVNHLIESATTKAIIETKLDMLVPRPQSLPITTQQP